VLVQSVALAWFLHPTPFPVVLMLCGQILALDATMWRMGVAFISSTAICVTVCFACFLKAYVFDFRCVRTPIDVLFVSTILAAYVVWAVGMACEVKGLLGKNECVY
jgi:hypothetical protein